MSSPPPRPPPPSTSRQNSRTEMEVEPQSGTHSRDFSSNPDTEGFSHERRRSNTYSGPRRRSISPPTCPTRQRLMSASPPPSLPILTEQGGGKEERGRGMVAETNSDGFPRPPRPPPPARARSLPRGSQLKMWGEQNGDIIKPNFKSSENVCTTLQDGAKSPAHTDIDGPDLVLNGDKPLGGDTPEGAAEVGEMQPTDSTKEGEKSSDVQAEDKTAGAPSSSPSVTSQSTPSPSSSAPPTQPVIPPRPYRPPRPFPPPSTSQPPSSSSSKQHKRMTHHGHPRHKTPHQQKDDTTILSKSVEPVKTFQIDLSRNNSRDSSDTGSDVTLQGVMLSDDGKSHDTSHDTSHDPEQTPTIDNGTGGAANGEIAQPPAQTIAASNSCVKTRSGGKGRRLFKSVRKGFSLMLHKNSQSDATPPFRRITSAFIGTDTLDEIEEDTTYPDPLPQGIVDPLVVLCVAYLNRDSVLREAGLFRIPGDHGIVKKLRSDYIRGEPVDLMHVLDPHTIAGLLKYHFREWRVSIIPRGQPLSDITAAVKDKDVDGVKDVLQILSQDNLATLRMVAELLSKVAEYSEWNKMTSGTLATSCGQSFFPYLPPSPANTLLKFMIDHCETLFSE